LSRAVNVGCVRYISSAARLKFPSRATARKHSNCLNSTLSPFGQLFSMRPVEH
jgi:hypothetical protein